MLSLLQKMYEILYSQTRKKREKELTQSSVTTHKRHKTLITKAVQFLKFVTLG